MAKPTIRRVKSGDRVRAADWNAMADIVEGLAAVRAGPGITAGYGAQGLWIALTTAMKTRGVVVKITEAPDPQMPILPSDCKYGYQGLDKSISDTGVLPVYGRPCHGDDHHIWPAHVGHFAFILRNPQADGTTLPELLVMTEYAYTGPC